VTDNFTRVHQNPRPYTWGQNCTPVLMTKLTARRHPFNGHFQANLGKPVQKGLHSGLHWS